MCTIMIKGINKIGTQVCEVAGNKLSELLKSNKEFNYDKEELQFTLALTTLSNEL